MCLQDRNGGCCERGAPPFETLRRERLVLFVYSNVMGGRHRIQGDQIRLFACAESEMSAECIAQQV